MLLEDQRFIHEDLERLEQGIADRVIDDPRNLRERLSRDHQVAGFLDRIEEQSKRLLDIYKDAEGLRAQEIQSISTGDPFEEFYKRLDDIKDFHKRYPNEPVENLERAYKRKHPGEGEPFALEAESMFTGEEAYGQFFDLTQLHEQYLNIPGVKRLSYIQYIDQFDVFTPPQLPIKRTLKLSDRYFKYVGNLAGYLEGFMKRARPLDNLEKLFASFDAEFEKQWSSNEVPGWGPEVTGNGPSGPKTEGTGEGIWCADCEKEFKNENVYKNHLTGKKHIKAAEAKKSNGSSDAPDRNQTAIKDPSFNSLKERAVAEREHRIRSLAKTLESERQATRVNVERKQGMTERERQMEIEALMADAEPSYGGQPRDDESDEEGDDKIYNPLKLPLAWDGKPIPYWLYKLHGLGVELPCEICGNFVYMGRRAFEKHFSEARHIYGLKCLGITQQTNLFREIVRIEDAVRLWEKLEQDRKKEKDSRDNVVQMEDAEGNVMPERIYHDLQKQERNRHLKAASAAKSQNPDHRTISSWFTNHSKRIHDKETNLLALLSCLFPEKRPDKVYWLQSTSLARVIARCLYLGSSRIKDLDQWRLHGGGDLGQCVENVMSQAENKIIPGQEVTVEEIEDALREISSRCRFSGPAIRKTHSAVDVDEVLGPLYRRLSSRDSKWLTRMILKSYSPVQLPVDAVLKNMHFLLPQLLLFQDSFEGAVHLLRSTGLKHFPPRPQSEFAHLLSREALRYLVPRPGLKVGRPEFYKARSLKHCCKMINRRRMSLERKYDGEYCQIHIDITKGVPNIRIFSKSGKDSTVDRAGIHQTVKRSLKLGERDCKISRRCILEGELLVWSDRDAKILEFHKLRKFLSRSGRMIGTDYDSQPKSYEHLMIMFFDILLLDDDACLGKPHRLRRLLLKDTVTLIPGRADISEQEVIDFSQPDGPRRLQIAFSKCISERWEGYILKGCDEPYFAILSSDTKEGFCRWIKLKKDYIPGLGDTADFCLVGARYDPKDTQHLSNMGHLSWNQFFIGCLDNKDAVIQSDALPRFRLIEVIGRHSLSASDMQMLNQWGKFVACQAESNHVFETFSLHNSLPEMDIAFKTPFVVELLGSGFDKPGNTQYYTLRFPRVLKVHWDRTFRDAISFSELQSLADKARLVPEQGLLEETSLWYEKIGEAHGRSEYIIETSQASSHSTVLTSTPPSLQGTLTVTAARPTPPPSRGIGDSSPDKSALKKSNAPLLLKLQPTSKRDTPPSRSSSDLDPSQTSVKRRKVLSTTSTMATFAPQPPTFFQSLRDRGSPIPKSNVLYGKFQTSSFSQFNENMDKMKSTMPLGESPNPPLRQKAVSIPQPSFNDPVKGTVDNYHSKPAIPMHSSDTSPVRENLNGVHIDGGHDFLSRRDMINSIPRPLSDRLESPLCTIPMYCGDFGFVETLFRQAPRDFTFSMTRFVQTLGAPSTRERLRASNPSSADCDMALGIILINKRDPGSTLATQLYNIGNLVASSLQSQLSTLPSQGKIFFLDRNILHAESGVQDETFLLNDWWAEYGVHYYYASISWGFGIDLGQVTQRVDEARQLGTHAALYDLRKTTNVVNVYEPSDVEILGEFVSIEPTVHLLGDYYYAPG
ncbi:splicing factor 3A subunit 3 [Talaromyces islandicus]|uniref:Splicing factor 3A subunit 3 n=1 Tax=Talaromyces islandicus TaxID=28573 RepID=A0A0U1LXZ9_TALIS|nr:splicing factor 3A subunit 3 [Talaromyces islandicus]